MLAALSIALLQALERCPACATSGKDVRLCAPHAEEERAAFTRAGKRLGSKDPGEVCAGLDELARLTRAHANAPSRRVAERLVAALDDEPYAVRAHATLLLGPPQNALVAMTGLLRAFRSVEAERERLEKERDKLRAKLDGPPRPSTERRLELERDEAARGREIEALMAWRAALLERLASFPDDRVVDAILDEAPRGLVLGGNQALLRLGSQRALRGVVDSIRVFEGELLVIEEMAAKLEGSMAGRDDQLGDSLRDVFKETLAKMRAEAKEPLAELVALVAERGLGPAPEESAHPHAAWEQWLAAHHDAQPAHLPGVTSPAW